MSRYPVPLLVGIAISLAVGAAEYTRPLQKAELFFYDTRMAWRDAIDDRAVPLCPDIRMILIDQRSYDRLLDAESPDRTRRHPVFWLPYYGSVIKGVLEAGARVVGLDLVPQYFEDSLFESFGLAAVQNPGRIVVICMAEVDESRGGAEVFDPPAPLVAALQSDNLGLANLSRDFDGVERSQIVLPSALDIHAAGQAPHREARSYFATLLAERFSGRTIERSADGVTFGGTPLPVLSASDPRLLINYHRVGAFPRDSFVDVLQRLQDRDWMRRTYRGKLVLVGLGARRDRDLVETPVTQQSRLAADSATFVGPLTVSMLGLEVHANLINTLLTAAFLRRASAALNRTLLAVGCVTAAFLAYYLTVPIGITAVVALMAAYLGAAWWLFARGSLWIDCAAALIGLPLVLTVTYAYRYMFEEREKNKVRSLFARSVSREVMEELVRDPRKAKLGATERRTVTVLFADINGFSTVAETRDAGEVMAMLNRFFEEMTAVIFRNHGTVKQFVGDEIMVMYGAPRAHPQPEVAAVRTALQMTERLQYLRQQDADGSHGFYSIKIGIHSGSVIVGNVGSAERSEYAAVGDDVNVGARLMGMTREVGASILISQATYDSVKDNAEFEFVSHGEMPLRGRREKMCVYEVRERKPKGEAA